MAVGLWPWPKRWRGRCDDPPPVCGWQRALWLSAWLVWPVYGFFYCRSVDDFVSPMVWIHGIIALVWGHPLRMAAAAVLAAVLWRCGGSTPVERLRRLGQWVLIAAVVLSGCFAAYALWHRLHEEALRKHIEWQAIWMPRYAAIVWPAVAITAAASLWRLPGRFLRWGAIVLLLGVNLAQGAARVWVNGEPPLDRIATDVLEARKTGATVRTYAQDFPGVGLPARGSIGDLTGRYYLAILGGIDLSPDEMYGGFVSKFFGLQCNVQGEFIRDDLASRPQIQKAIVWERFSSMPAEAKDFLSDANWRLEQETILPVYDFWNWQKVHVYRRRQYGKVVPPATMPASQPVTKERRRPAGDGETGEG